MKLKYFSVGEWALWLSSIGLILCSFIAFEGGNIAALIASLIGVTALIFTAKGHPIGQVLMIAFCIMYGIISYFFAYYGELITYAGMSLPMSILSLISWLRHPAGENTREVAVNRISGKEHIFMWGIALPITVSFYFILEAFNTKNLLPSTISVATSFLAVYLTFRRDPLYAVAYAANDIILIVLWSMASAAEPRYLAMVICFAAFLANDIYGFFNWHRMGKRQKRKK